ncbi:MAG: hypothetical protein U1E32_09845 [Rhodoglobus sp.]|nr:hypothetical protein [Rhodoglobus sp.]
MSDSQTGPVPVAASPKLATTMPGCRRRRLLSAAPVAIGAEPPTIALFGKMPSGGKNACMLPPRPRLKPVERPNVSAAMP